MYCSNCGQDIGDKSTFCSRCGFRVVSASVEKKKSRIVELVLGILAGLFGFGVGIFIYIFGRIGETIGAEKALEATTIGSVGILFSFISIIGAILVRSKPKIGGSIMILTAIVYLLTNNLLYGLTIILLLVAGVMTLINEKNMKVYTIGLLILFILSLGYILNDKETLREKIFNDEKSIKSLQENLEDINKRIYINSSAETVDRLNKDAREIKPKNGYIFMIVNINIENKGYDEFYVYSPGFRLIYKGVAYYPYQYNINLENELPSNSKIVDRGILNGNMTFEVPSNIEEYEIKYEQQTFIKKNIEYG